MSFFLFLLSPVELSTVCEIGNNRSGNMFKGKMICDVSSVATCSSK
jgi:hypothetical protein